MPEIETKRLTLTPYVADDAEAMARLHGDQAVMANMKGGLPLSESEAAETFQRYLMCWREFGMSIFAARLKSDGAYVGECGFWYRTDKPGVSMRFLLLPDHWGEGLGWEMNAAVTRWLFTETDVMSFWAVTRARNKGAVAILRRIGGLVTETAHMGEEGLLRFDVNRDDWRDTQKN